MSLQIIEASVMFVNVLSSAVENGNSRKIFEKHIKDIKDMLSEDRIFH